MRWGTTTWEAGSRLAAGQGFPSRLAQQPRNDHLSMEPPAALALCLQVDRVFPWKHVSGLGSALPALARFASCSLALSLQLRRVSGACVLTGGLYIPTPSLCHQFQSLRQRTGQRSWQKGRGGLGRQSKPNGL